MNDVRRRQVLAAVGGAVGTTGCVGVRSDSEPQGARVAVGSKRFTANRLLGWMAFETLLADDTVQPVDRIGLGGTDETWQALVDREIQCYWDYTGTIWRHILDRTERHENPTDLYTAVDRALADRDIAIASRARYENSFVLYARADWVDETGVRSLGDLFQWLDHDGDDFTVAITESFSQRTDGWSALLDHYGLQSDAKQRLAERTDVVEPLVTYQLLDRGTHEVGLGYSTNPNVVDLDVVALADDQQFFPPYEPVLLVDQTAPTADDIRTRTAPIGDTVRDAERMRLLAYRIAFENESARDVARAHLDEAGVR